MIHKWRPWKLYNFQDPPPSCPSASKILPPLWPWTSNGPRPSPFQTTTNQFKEKKSKDDYHMLSGPSFRSAFVFIINSLILPGFPLTSFHLFEASLSAFPWLYALVCAVVQKYHKHVNEPCMWTNEIKTKTKPNHVTFKLTTRSIVYLAHKQCNGMIKGLLHCLMLSIIYWFLAQHDVWSWRKFNFL